MKKAFAEVWKQIPKRIFYVIYIVICLSLIVRYLYDVTVEGKNMNNLPLLLQLIAIFIVLSFFYLIATFPYYSLKTISKLGYLQTGSEKTDIDDAQTKSKLLSCVLDADINVPMVENSTIEEKSFQYVQGYCFITNISQKNVAVAAVQINDKYHITSYPFEYVSSMDWRGLIKPNEHLRIHFFGYIPSGVLKNRFLFKKRNYSTADLTIIDNFSNKYKISKVNFLFVSKK